MQAARLASLSGVQLLEESAEELAGSGYSREYAIRKGEAEARAGKSHAAASAGRAMHAGFDGF